MHIHPFTGAGHHSAIQKKRMQPMNNIPAIVLMFLTIHLNKKWHVQIIICLIGVSLSELHTSESSTTPLPSSALCLIGCTGLVPPTKYIYPMCKKNITHGRAACYNRIYNNQES